MTQYTKFYPQESGYTLDDVAGMLNEAMEIWLEPDEWDCMTILPGEIPLSYAQAWANGYYNAIVTWEHGDTEDSKQDRESEFERDALTVFLYFGDHECDFIGTVLKTYLVKTHVTLHQYVEVDPSKLWESPSYIDDEYLAECMDSQLADRHDDDEWDYDEVFDETTGKMIWVRV